MKKVVNGVYIDMTAEEISARQAEEQIWLEEQSKNKKELINKIANQVSGNQKLLDLGLTQAEATALTGYKPPDDEEEE